LAQKAMEAGYHPEIILAGRRMNDSMGEYVASEVVKLMIKKEIVLHKAELLLLGITFKENCPDVRNTKIVDIIHALKEYGINITIYDPWAKPEEVLHEYGIVTTKIVPTSQFDALILGVSHDVFNTLDINSLTKSNNVVYDVKGFLTAEVDGRL